MITGEKAATTEPEKTIFYEDIHCPFKVCNPSVISLVSSLCANIRNQQYSYQKKVNTKTARSAIAEKIKGIMIFL